MSTRYVFPTLLVEGYINRSVTVFDQMLSDFFLSEFNQTFAFPGKVKSFPYVIQEHQHEPDRLTVILQDMLTSYFQTQFESVEVTVDQKPEEGSNNRYGLYIYARVTDMLGETFSLDRLVSYTGNRVHTINNIIREG